MIRLTRFYYDEEKTLGRLVYGDFKAWTVERPSHGNLPSISCIPEGGYLLRRYNSPKFGKRTWQVERAPGRTYIAIHSANFANQLEGCVAAGSRLLLDDNGNPQGIGGSRETVKELYRLTEELEQIGLMIERGAVIE